MQFAGCIMPAQVVDTFLDPAYRVQKLVCPVSAIWWRWHPQLKWIGIMVGVAIGSPGQLVASVKIRGQWSGWIGTWFNLVLGKHTLVVANVGPFQYVTHVRNLCRCGTKETRLHTKLQDMVEEVAQVEPVQVEEVAQVEEVPQVEQVAQVEEDSAPVQVEEVAQAKEEDEEEAVLVQVKVLRSLLDDVIEEDVEVLEGVDLMDLEEEEVEDMYIIDVDCSTGEFVDLI